MQAKGAEVMKITSNNLTPAVLKQITDILNRGLVAEVKRERDNVVVVEIKRKAQLKEPITVNKIDKI